MCPINLFTSMLRIKLIDNWASPPEFDHLHQKRLGFKKNHGSIEALRVCGGQDAKDGNGNGGMHRAASEKLAFIPCL